MIVPETDLLAYLGLECPNAQETLLVNRLHKSVERSVKRLLGFDPEQKTHEELLPAGDGPGRSMAGGNMMFEIYGNRAIGQSDTTARRRLQLSHVPVRSITSLYEDVGAYAGTADGAFGAGTQLTEGADFYADYDATGVCHSGLLYRIGSWPNAPKCVKVTYVAGYSEDELAGDDDKLDVSDIRLAIMEQFAADFNRSRPRGVGGITSERLGDYSVTFSDRAVDAAMLPQVLARLQPFINYARVAAR